MIILAATPIGNLQDASPRLREALAAAEVVAAEDTRTTLNLLRALDIDNRPRLISLHEHNERTRIADVLDLARDGDVLVVSDAGMPTVSDPGFPLVEAAAAEGIEVRAIPGPSAVVTALAVSGLPSDRFTFEGFVPRKRGQRLAQFTALADEPRTMVFFESPNRLTASLTDLAAAFGGERRAAVCRELTKRFEEVRRGTLDELTQWAADGVRGEICVVVAGADPVRPSFEGAVADVLSQVDAGTRLKDATRDVARTTGHSARELYEAALRDRGPHGRA